MARALERLRTKKLLNNGALKGKYYRDSPDSAIFWSPANRTIGKTALIETRFSTKIVIWDF